MPRCPTTGLVLSIGSFCHGRSLTASLCQFHDAGQILSVLAGQGYRKKGELHTIVTNKQIVLADFMRLRCEGTPEGNQGGRGYPDPDILPLCDWLNTYERVCTLQSCAGHSPRPGHGASEGVLWVVLPDTAITKLRSLASEFVRLPIIQVSVCWSLHEREFVSVGFRGNESGQLGSSLAALKRMFSAILED